MDIVEHTGHGVPTIIEKYGKEVFDISENYIMVTIPFEETVSVSIGDKNVGINVGINKTEEAILEIILRDPKSSQKSIATEINKTQKTVERNLSKLIEKGYIVRQGSKKSGQWKVIK